LTEGGALTLREDDQAPAGTRENLLERGQKIVANPASEKPAVTVGGVVDEWQVEGDAIRLNLGPPHAEQRTREAALPRIHREKSARRCAAQSSHEHRLGLIVRGVAEGDDLRARGSSTRPKGGVSGPPCSILKRSTPRHVDTQRVKRHVGTDGDLGWQTRFGRRIGAQAVIDVSHGHAQIAGRREAQKHIEEGHRIGAPAARDQDGLAGPQHAVPVERTGHFPPNPGHRRDALGF